MSKGDVRERENTPVADVELAAREIGLLIAPLAILAPSLAEFGQSIGDEDISALRREVWFNIAVHGIIPGSSLWIKHADELRQLAIYSRPLIAEGNASQSENDIELNTVLRRGMNGPRTAEMKKSLIALLPKNESTIRSLAYPKVIFLHAAFLLETLRAENGHCADVLSYFIEPSVSQDDIVYCMEAIASEVMAIYLRRSLSGSHAQSTAPLAATELARILVTCCHRVPKCQQVAAFFADRLVAQMPSSLCQKTSLFALLELLTLMWHSCLDAEIDEYEWKSKYVSSLANVSLELSDDFDFRKRTLNGFQKRARAWMMRVINVAPLDVKGLLQVRGSRISGHGH